MDLKEKVELSETLGAGYLACVPLKETVGFGRASMHVQQLRPSRFVKVDELSVIEAKEDDKKWAALVAKGAKIEIDGVYIPDVDSYEALDLGETVWNQITNAGRDFLHSQGYNTSGIGANGLNYVALTNTAVTPAAGDTTLSGEIAANGLSRAQGAYAHTASTNTTTITITFTCSTAPQAAQAAALFTASSSGTMNHELTFTQRSLQIGDQIIVTYTITLG